MIKNLITVLLIILSGIAIAQPKTQNLSAIDPRLINGFTMTELKLTVNEFKGKAPQGSADISDSRTFIGLRKLQTLQMEDNKSKYRFEIIPYFSFNSWLADTVKANPQLLMQVLKHEQNHYDIRLLMAAELKKQLSNTWFDSRDYAKGILAIRDKLSKEEFTINQLYETETNHGRNVEAQLKWDELVSNALQTNNWAALTHSL